MEGTDLDPDMSDHPVESPRLPSLWGHRDFIPLGTFVGGILGSRIGLRPTLWVSAVIGLVAFLAPLLSDVRRLREMPTLEEPAGPFLAPLRPELPSRSSP